MDPSPRERRSRVTYVYSSCQSNLMLWTAGLLRQCALLAVKVAAYASVSMASWAPCMCEMQREHLERHALSLLMPEQFPTEGPSNCLMVQSESGVLPCQRHISTLATICAR